jgi:endonuclease YncB( thermonuclease family)
MSKSKNLWKKVTATAIVTTSLGLGFWASKAFYTVKEVIDGDTFVTQENQHVRLDSVNAPALNRCLGNEAKSELEKLVLNKKVFIKVTYINGLRLVGSVYTISGSVGEKMLATGLATFADKGNQNQKALLRISQSAREKGIGVYSSKCTQSENPINPKCNIKGNTTGDENLYRYPGCRLYNSTLIQLHFGDLWFCSEKEAKKSGFAKGKDCS